MSHEEADQFLMGGGGRSAQFKKHGDQVDGYITSAEVRQQTDYDTGAPMTWDDGRPRNQLVVTLETQLREDDDDDGLRRLYVRGQMTRAVADAVRKTGEPGLRLGGRLFVRYVSDDEPKRKGMQGAKQYIAKYQAPSVPVPVDEDAEPDFPDSPF